MNNGSSGMQQLTVPSTRIVELTLGDSAKFWGAEPPNLSNGKSKNRLALILLVGALR
jgi:hypothetical protein